MNLLARYISAFVTGGGVEDGWKAVAALEVPDRELSPSYRASMCFHENVTYESLF